MERSLPHCKYLENLVENRSPGRNPGAPMSRPFLVLAIRALLASSLPSFAAPPEVNADPTVPSGFQLELWSGSLPSGCINVAIAPTSFGTHGGEAFLSRNSSHEIWRVDAAGTVTAFTSVQNLPNGLSFGPGGTWGENLYVNCNSSAAVENQGMIWEVNASATATAKGTPTPPSHVYAGGGLAFSTGGPFGDYVYAGISAGNPGDCISRLPPTFAPPAAVFSNFPGQTGPYNGAVGGLKFGPGLAGWTNDLYAGLLDSDPGGNVISPGGIYRVGSDGTAYPFRTRLDDVRLQLPRTLSFGPGNAFGRSLYVATLDRVLRVESDGQVSVFMDGFESGTAIACDFAPSGALIVLDYIAQKLWRVTSGTTAVEAQAPSRLRLAPECQPSSGVVRLRLEAVAGGRARVEVFDTAGRRVATLLDEEIGAGTHSLAWNGADAKGSHTSTGIYFAVARLNAESVSTRLVRFTR